MMIGEVGLASQKTLKSAIHCRGVGLHTGAKVGVRLCPAEPDTGIVFRRVDRGGTEIAATWRNVVESSLCTTLANLEGVRVGTVEHLMAAVAGAELDNLVIEVDGPEIPIMDGSAAPFLFLIECAGIAEQDAARRAIKVLRPVVVGDETRSAALLPDDAPSLSFVIDFESRAINRQDICVALDSATFKTEIAGARTFGFLHEVDRMREAGLARGGSLDNSIVVSGDRILNEGGLRYADEFVRHKVLDAVGDLALAGAPILGHFRGVRSGHSLNRCLLEALFADPVAWCWTTLAAEAGLAEREWTRPALAATA
jgi:UDP-3-O-[3-hydroxymyristoyl] N-acetylglucosamine deacetylase